MKRRAWALGAIVCLAQAAATPWLTVAGDPDDPRADTIQVNPLFIMKDGPQRVMEVRVSRSTERAAMDGNRFRSFQALVAFDCEARVARFINSQFYNAPLWRDPGARIDYPESRGRTVEFPGFSPNPRDRVVQAACSP
nr:surface-adhesin E family protein [Variovorax boronicumulans]